jgi:cell division protein FtsI/penicillin-binding protein 2
LPKLKEVLQRKKSDKDKTIRNFILFYLVLINIFLWIHLKIPFFNSDSLAGNQGHSQNSYKNTSRKTPPAPASSYPKPIDKIPIAFQKVRRNKYIQRKGDREIIYTINVSLQKYTEKVLREYRVPYGVVVALDPTNGKILTLAGYSKYHRSRYKNMSYCFRSTFPAASIIKLVTAAAALELDSLRPRSILRYDGNMYQISPEKLKKWRKRDQITTFTKALAKSNNVVFARIAVHAVGSRNLLDYVQRFGFNRTLVDYLPMGISKAYIPEEPYELGKTGAGFGEVYMSPLHGAMIAATIAYGGKMLAPHLIEEIRDQRGRLLYQARKKSLGRVIRSNTARKLNRMMQETIRSGTCKKAFRDSRGRPFFPRMAISGKTGSLNGDNPRGAYHWFVGFAPSSNPKIAIAALVINSIDGAKWRIKGAHLARMVFQKFFSQ